MELYLAELSGRMQAVIAYLLNTDEFDKDIVLAMLGYEKEKEASTEGNQ